METSGSLSVIARGAATLLTLIVVFSVSAVAKAQGAADKPTKFEAIDASMETLLDSGYEIRTTNMGMFILGKQASPGQTSWAVCNVDIANGLLEGSRGNYRPPSSRCFALN